MDESAVLQENVVKNHSVQSQQEFSFLFDINEKEEGQDSGMKEEESSVPFCMDKDARSKLPLAQREKAVEDTIEWLRKQMSFLKDQDQNLMRKFLKIRTLLNSLQHSRPWPGRKVSLPEDAIAAYSLRRFSEVSEQHAIDMRKRSQSVFGEGISRFVTSVMTPESSMEELSED